MHWYDGAADDAGLSRAMIIAFMVETLMIVNFALGGKASIAPAAPPFKFGAREPPPPRPLWGRHLQHSLSGVMIIVTHLTVVKATTTAVALLVASCGLRLVLQFAREKSTAVNEVRVPKGSLHAMRHAPMLQARTKHR